MLLFCFVVFVLLCCVVAFFWFGSALSGLSLCVCVRVRVRVCLQCFVVFS